MAHARSRLSPEKSIVGPVASSLRSLLLLSLPVVGAAISIASCTSSDGPQAQTQCPKPAPAFALIVRSQSGMPLTRDTTLLVKFGSGSETFSLSGTNAPPSVVFCSVEPPGVDGGVPDANGVDETDGGADVGSIACALWTDGAADVTVMSTGLMTTEMTFESMSDECGIVTVPALLELPPSTPDAGM
jgi:hypothetical protein